MAELLLAITKRGGGALAAQVELFAEVVADLDGIATHSNPIFAEEPFTSGFDPNETSALDRRWPDRSRLHLHQVLLQPSKSSAANSRINSYLMGRSAWAAISQVSHARRLRDPKSRLS